MVIVIGTIQVDPARRDGFLAEQAEGLAAGRAEPGRLEYSVLSDPEQPDVVRLLERWADVPSFEAHLAALGARAAEGKTSLASDAVRGMQVTRYDVASSSKLA
jgi:quinol monooxygenase YgiN